MTQTTNLFNLNVEQCKQNLLKYCYFDSTLEGEQQRALTMNMIEKCSHDYTIAFLSTFLDKYIKIYFDVNRTKFNKIRREFMTHALISLLSLHQCRSVVSDCFVLYEYWLHKCEMHTCRACMTEYKRVKALLDSQKI